MHFQAPGTKTYRFAKTHGIKVIGCTALAVPLIAFWFFAAAVIMIIRVLG